MVIAGYYTIIDMSLHNNYMYQLWGAQSAHNLYPRIASDSACDQVMKRLSSKEWHIALAHNPS
jgi:hypothetical protein